jgi:hypothetical protein
VDISLTRIKKADTRNKKFPQEEFSTLENYDSVVYTDGSKMGEAVGYSIVNENQTFGKRINETCSVYTADARVIFDACLNLKNNSHRRVDIATDSLSTLMGVINPGNRHCLIRLDTLFIALATYNLCGYLKILAYWEIKMQMLR